MTGATHAIVVGAGIAGLCAASAVADTCGRVTLLDRDVLPDGAEPRPGTPQDRHVHAILGGGVRAMGELFPGLFEELIAGGAPTGDVLADTRVFVGGTRVRPTRCDIQGVAVGRPRLEHHMRRRLAERSNITVRSGTTVTGLTADGTGVTGVRAAEREHRADLVVDASGRGSRVARWLAELGYATPPETRIRTDMAYTSRSLAMPADSLGGDLAIVMIPAPATPRGGGLIYLGQDRWLVSLNSYRGISAPAEIDGFIGFAGTLATSDIHDALQQASATGEAAHYRVPAVVRRHYERMSDHPGGLVVVGDATANFNPTYGQGMSVAAMQALALRDHVRRHGPYRLDLVRHRIARVSDVAWTASVASDLRMPWIEGERTVLVRLGNAYLSMLLRAVGRSRAVARAFFRVTSLVDPPTALLRPSIVGRVLAGFFRRPSAGAGGNAGPPRGV